MIPGKNIQMYTPNKTYIEGWYTIDEIKEVLSTMERVNDVNDMLQRITNEELPEITTEK